MYLLEHRRREGNFSTDIAMRNVPLNLHYQYQPKAEFNTKYQIGSNFSPVESENTTITNMS